MRYEKPILNVVCAAAKAIESTESKEPSQLADHIDMSPNNTGPAYEADE